MCAMQIQLSIEAPAPALAGTAAAGAPMCAGGQGGRRQAKEAAGHPAAAEGHSADREADHLLDRWHEQAALSKLLQLRQQESMFC